MLSPAAWCCVATFALVQMPMVSCNGCGDPAVRMNGTIPAPSDADTYTILIGRTTFRVPRNVRFTDLGGGNYAGYLMHYQTFGGAQLRPYIQAQVAQYQGRQNPEADFDDAHHRVFFSFDSDDNTRHMELYQDLLDGGALVFEADYKPGAKSYAVDALTPLANDLIAVKRGDPIPMGMGMGNSVLARTVLNDEIANAYFTVPLPGYDTDDRSGLRIEIDSDMQTGFTDDLTAKCHNGQLAQYDGGKSFSNGQPELTTTDLLRYRERDAAGLPGGETVELQTAKDGSYRQADFTYSTDTVYPPDGHPLLTIRANTAGLQKDNDLRRTLAVWDGIVASARVIPMGAPARGIFSSAPPGYRTLPPCRSRSDVNLAAAPLKAKP